MEVILKRLSHLGLNVLSTIQGMSAFWDVRYWKVSLYLEAEKEIKQQKES